MPALEDLINRAKEFKSIKMGGRLALSPRAACGCSGISEDSFARYLAASADFADAITRAEAEAAMTHVIDERAVDRFLSHVRQAAETMIQDTPPDHARPLYHCFILLGN